MRRSACLSSPDREELRVSGSQQGKVTTMTNIADLAQIARELPARENPHILIDEQEDDIGRDVISTNHWRDQR